MTLGKKIRKKKIMLGTEIIVPYWPLLSPTDQIKSLNQQPQS